MCPNFLAFAAFFHLFECVLFCFCGRAAVFHIRGIPVLLWVYACTRGYILCIYSRDRCTLPNSNRCSKNNACTRSRPPDRRDHRPDAANFCTVYRTQACKACPYNPCTAIHTPGRLRRNLPSGRRCGIGMLCIFQAICKCSLTASHHLINTVLFPIHGEAYMFAVVNTLCC